MAYDGQERRIHRVFVTRNTEYHVRHDTCVGVRDRDTGAWLARHFALNLPVAGAIKFLENGGLNASTGLPSVGESIYFETQGRDLVTSSVLSVERPPADVVASYPSA